MYITEVRQLYHLLYMYRYSPSHGLHLRNPVAQTEDEDDVNLTSYKDW